VRGRFSCGSHLRRAFRLPVIKKRGDKMQNITFIADYLPYKRGDGLETDDDTAGSDGRSCGARVQTATFIGSLSAL
jgi:hypothetical protein